MNKILFMTRKFPPSTGGMELFAYELSESLAEQNKLTLLKWGGSNKALPVVLPWLWLQGVWQVMNGGVSVIHGQDAIMAPPVWLLARLFRKPYTIVVHGLDLSYKNSFYQAVIPWFVRRADAVFCISTAAAEEATSRGVSPEKVHIIPLAVRDVLYGKADRAELLQKLELKKDTPILLTVGRLVKRKGVAWFIANVLPGLVKKYPELVYVVVGKGGMQAEIESATEKAGMTKHVRLLGRVTGTLYEATYNGADVFVMPNIEVPGDIEGFGLVLLEASLCERPIVASNMEGIADAVVDGKNAVLVESKDIAAFTREISVFLDNPKAAKAFGAQSRAYTNEHYQWSNIAAQYAAVYEKVTKR